ncbi:hypothetical protein, partial [Serratia marcescens]|uniref:hypothetical protein n=1 Tax=Serratia marcescens TaxID=615 RepID=UPI00281402D1
MNDVLILARLSAMLEEVELKLNRLNELGSWCPEYTLEFNKSEFSYLFWPSTDIPKEKVTFPNVDATGSTISVTQQKSPSVQLNANEDEAGGPAGSFAHEKEAE